MKTIILLYCIFFSVNCNAQRTEKFYDYLWRPSTIDKAVYFSVREPAGDVFHQTDYYIRESKLQMDGYYKDTAGKIKHGDFHYYYPGGITETISNYVDNKLNGVYMHFHNNGMMSDSANYINGNTIGNSFSWFPDGMTEDSTFKREDGSGTSISWHSNGQPAAAGMYGVGGKKIKTWQYFHFNGNLSAKEKYEDGKLIDKSYYDENGNLESDTTSIDREVSFPGGIKAWQKFIYKRAYFPEGWKIVNTDAVVVVVTATVDEEGNIKDAYVSTPFHPDFDKIALKALIGAPKWLPAISHHRKVQASFRQPITFQQQ